MSTCHYCLICVWICTPWKVRKLFMRVESELMVFILVYNFLQCIFVHWYWSLCIHAYMHVYDISKSDLVISTLITFLLIPATCSFLCLPVRFVYIHSCMATLFSGLSVGCCINRERGYLLPTWAWKISCQCFKWMLQLPSEQKWKKYDQMLLFIALHYSGYTSLEVTKVGEDCSSLSASSLQRSSNQGLPVLHLGWSAPLRVSFDLQWRVSSVWLHIFKP